MHVVLLGALGPVLRDIRSSGAPEPVVADEPWEKDSRFASVMLWGRDGSGRGVSVALADPEPDRVASVADQVQEWVIEELWALGATNWPSCPRHPDSHPLAAAARCGVAVWYCPDGGVAVAPVGSLS